MDADVKRGGDKSQLTSAKLECVVFRSVDKLIEHFPDMAMDDVLFIRRLIAHAFVEGFKEAPMPTLEIKSVDGDKCSFESVYINQQGKEVRNLHGWMMAGDQLVFKRDVDFSILTDCEVAQ